MIWTVAQDLGVEYGEWVHLYQSRFFEDEFPEENEQFRNVTYTERMGQSKDESLRHMRDRMFSDSEFSAGVFIGGMEGVAEEFSLFQMRQPGADLLPVVSTGGAVHDIASELRNVPRSLIDDLDYVGVFHTLLGISVREERFPHPNDQPAAVEDRYWRPG